MPPKEEVMSEEITIHDGGEAPLAAKSIASIAVSGEDQGSLMQQNGGQAPEPGAEFSNALQQDSTVGAPPLGGVVLASSPR
jgi:hypothetical protein